MLIPFACGLALRQSACSPAAVRAGKKRNRLVRWSRRRVTDRNTPASPHC